ncbi:putative midasin [Apostichopus japonicus]|uniref:Putative midasin n=1 Tax=Stichopus japonicus TaxID=307972 RepID=A0A2G8K3V0_STIJA|nr:putative midasin [Apostichopus japonicus]
MWYVTRFSKLMKIALLHLTNHIQTVATISDSSYQTLQSILGQFMHWWHQSEEERKRKEEEEASLFKYKKQSHGSDEKPEEEEERELKKAFPSYEKDFSDIAVDPTEDPLPSSSPSPPPEMEDDEDAESILRLDEATQGLVQTIHGYLFIRPRLKQIEPALLQRDIKDVLTESYHCAAELFNDSIQWMESGVDARLTGAHLTLSKIHQDTISGTIKGHHVMHAGKPFDIYHDANPSEATKCRPLLEELTTKVDKLMEEWPEHPALKHLKLFISRIESFPVNSPLMKFVTGLEMLLAKAQDWETMAAKYVSLQTQLGKITELVITWRKMELSFWSCSLDSVAYNHRRQVVKWWFHLYNVLQNTTSDLVRSDGDEDVDKDGDGEDLDQQQGWLSSLYKFMESSTLGDMKTRLDMVLAFHNQLTVSGDGCLTGSAVPVSSVLWNLYRYYKQFLPGVTEELTKQRTPLEKELKQFVKISRWNDINFWAMKVAVEKSHKTVHKLCKKFQAMLESPAKSVFTEVNLSGKQKTTDEDNFTKSDLVLDVWVKSFDVVDEMISSLIEKSPETPDLSVADAARRRPLTPTV